MMTELNIGRKIKELRKENDMTAKTLSEHLELSPSFMSAIENNSTKLSLSTLSRICDVLNVSLAEFFTETLTPIEKRLITLIKELPEERKYKLLLFLEEFS